MKALARRGFLKALGIAPGAAVAVAHNLKAAALNPGGSASLPPVAGSYANAVGVEPKKFKSVAEWWEEFGHKEAEQGSRYVGSIDADLIEMRLPLATKVRIQQKRNYERVKSERWAQMARSLSLNGLIEWYA